MLHWIIVYPCGDRSRLAAVQAIDYEKDEYDIAYDYWWPDTEEGEKECKEKLEYLADKHGLEVKSRRKYLT
jgi:hypothetical protein